MTKPHDPADEFELAKDKYLAPVISKIRESIASRQVGEHAPISFYEAWTAFDDYFRPLASASKPTWGDRFFDNLFLIVAVLMTISFGLFAVWAGDEASTYIDLAKVFAGAIVGGAAGSAAANKRSK